MIVKKKSSIEQKTIKKKLELALREFLVNNLESALTILEEIEEFDLDTTSLFRLRRTLLIFILGEFFDLHTMRSILKSVGIGSNNVEKIWTEQTYEDIQTKVTKLLVQLFIVRLVALMKQSDSSWSRANVVIVVDDSIFKQWLQNGEHCEFFDKFFSGQTHKTEYGFQLLLIGVSINDEFYPLYFRCVSKAQDKKEAALKLVKKVHNLLEETAVKQGVTYPSISLSVDSGYRYEPLALYCKSKEIHYIFSGKRNHVLYYKGTKTNVLQLIKDIFLPQEKAYEEQQKKTGNGDAPPFSARLRVTYKSMDREVVVLLFRLNGSKKVTAIFCTSLEIKGKTLRRHFFQRTKIEFFLDS